MRQIINTTDGKFIGRIFDQALPIVFDGVVFAPDKVVLIAPDTYRYSNSNYVIDAKEV